MHRVLASVCIVCTVLICVVQHLVFWSGVYMCIFAYIYTYTLDCMYVRK